MNEIITPGFAPGCPSALQRGLWLLYSNGALESLGWPRGFAAQLVAIAPAVLITIAAFWGWHAARARLTAAAIVVATAIHTPLGLVLAPLLLRNIALSAGTERPAARHLRWGAVVPAMTLVAAVAIGLWLAPPCQGASRDAIRVILAEAVRVLAAGAGPLIVLLAAISLLSNMRSDPARALLLVTASGIVALLLLPPFDRRLTLTPLVVALWWLAAAAVRTQLSLRHSRAARAGAAAVLLFALLLQPVRRIVLAESPEADATGFDPVHVHRALDATVWPATIVSEDPGHDLFLAMWRSGGHGRQRGAEIDRLDPAALGTLVPARPLYAFERSAARLSNWGFRLMPLAPPAGGPDPILWRAIDYVPCREIATAWQDVSAQTADGHFVVSFTQGGTTRTAWLYAAVPRGTVAAPVGWPDGDLTGFTQRVFDLSQAAGRAELETLARGDEFDVQTLINGAEAVARLTIARTVFSAGLLRVVFNGPVPRAYARMNTSPGYGDVVRLCRTTDGDIVIGGADAPETTRIPVQSRGPFGPGWYDPEREGTERFRWTSGTAHLRFFAVSPQRLILRLDGQSPLGGLERAGLRVELNGQAAACDKGTPPCEWHLPLEAIRPGFNTITLHANVTQGMGSDTRTFGVMVKTLALVRVTR